MSADPDAIRRRDEILQVMFWMRGEGLAETASASKLRLFLDSAADVMLVTDLAALEAAGLVEPVGPGEWRLSARGLDEGGRRFTEEFADYTHRGHGVCSDPACDCHELGPAACAGATSHVQPEIP